MKSWTSYVDLLASAAEVLDLSSAPRNDHLTAAFYRQLAMNLSQGYFLYFQSSPDHPEFAPFENSVFLAQPNPDAVYYYARVEGNGTYRIVGERGNAPVAGFAVGNKIIGMDENPGKGLGNFDIDDLQIGSDGAFEVIFSRDRPTSHAGNWLPLHEDADFILVRQFSYDWGHETDMRLAIERLDAPPIKPPMSPETTDRLLTQLFGAYPRNLSKICIEAVERARAAGFVNRMRLNSFQELGNSRDWPQAYFETVFDIAGNEALIIETDLPEARPYWNIQVIDALWNQVELVYRQSSLNGHQARIDPDGKFRAVLAHQDPKIHNWLDTGGNLSGMLIGRWYRCSSQPTPTVTKIKFAELRQHLPVEVPIISQMDRALMLRERRIGAQLRRRW
ncbi:MAG: DUF1214 domain-containing protein [Rhodospirillales bacterium]